MVNINTNISTSSGNYDASFAGGSTVTINKAGTNATLTIDKSQLNTLIKELASGDNPKLSNPENDSDPITNNQQLTEVGNSTMDLGDLIAQIMSLINQENQTYTKEQIAGIASAMQSYQSSLDSADNIKSAALQQLFGSLAMAGVSLAMTVGGTIQGYRAAGQAEEVAGSENYQPKSMTNTEFEENASTSKSPKNPKNQEQEEVSKLPNSPTDVQPSSLETEQRTSSQVQNRANQGAEKLKGDEVQAQNEKSRNSEQLVNEKGLTKVERDKLFNQAYMNKTQTFQMWTQFGNMAGGTLEKGFGVGAANQQAQSTIHQADSQLANTTQQSFASNAQQLNSFFESVRSQIGSIMSGQFQLAGKV